MDMKTKISQALNGEYKGIDGLIAVAYWIGKHDGVVEVCDKHRAIISAMRDRARAVRYHHLANNVIGQGPGQIYHPDYSSDFPDWTVEEINPVL